MLFAGIDSRLVISTGNSVCWRISSARFSKSIIGSPSGPIFSLLAPFMPMIRRRRVADRLPAASPDDSERGAALGDEVAVASDRRNCLRLYCGLPNEESCVERMSLGGCGPLWDILIAGDVVSVPGGEDGADTDESAARPLSCVAVVVVMVSPVPAAVPVRVRRRRLT